MFKKYKFAVAKTTLISCYLVNREHFQFLTKTEQQYSSNNTKTNYSRHFSKFKVFICLPL